ncbi:23S rRNA (uracil(1939)-C(5))-methyltransferase RlmD [Nitratidesulfovibrio liaohensis]|uniref:23S rRNA (Uracil(1939)-C(5))-methyltransferase RlmD n=1 Tax=Nitratidesulfovibrio liaohensis TaxID=2604158 RepID=A0ABY9R5W9_9BACT|nr:23S rRNA (uracil(1939)-C(5))-methyltransferase RlmD [Nitratidesulfovibrio liaohensis]WMW67022.1 23S rRNA (uracil(1939)-C(5))-methyltransferase RlmD [Nitratidesulfovibrio liaohensis]
MSDTTPRPGDLLELTVDGLAAGGRAVCRHEGRVVFVAGGLPGQRVRAKLTAVKRRFAEATPDAVLEPSPIQCAPFCAHFGDCGGCAWQDLPYAEQLRWKERFVVDALGRIGGLRDANVLPILGSPAERGFRNKMEFAFNQDRDGQLHLGLRRRASRAVVDITECHLQTQLTVRIVEAVRDLARESGLPGWDDGRQDGFWRFLVVREPELGRNAAADTGAEGDGQGNPGRQCMIQCITGRHPGAAQAVSRLAEALRARFPEVTGVVHSLRLDPEQIAYGERVLAVDGEAVLTERLGGNDLLLGPDSFFQTNTAAAGLLYDEARRMAAAGPDDTVWDLYSGVGAIALHLARAAGAVRGFEITPEAVNDARANAARNNILNCSFVSGDVRASLRRERPGEGVSPRIVVMDPPRAGLHEDVVEAVAAHQPERIVYVSCNPATMARDVALFTARGYALQEARPVDLFPHSPHVECVALLTRAGE